MPRVAMSAIIAGEVEVMPFYLTRFSYTPETWARLVKNPEDRRAAAKQYIESVGGKLHGFWYAFGDHDAYNLWEAPDNVSMAAVAVAISAGGALSSLQTTPLLTVEETMAQDASRAEIAAQTPLDCTPADSGWRPQHDATASITESAWKWRTVQPGLAATARPGPIVGSSLADLSPARATGAPPHLLHTPLLI
jgi:uncharacterized protein with GYD domain